MNQTKLDAYAKLTEAIEEILALNSFDEEGGTLTDYMIISTQVRYEIDEDMDMMPIPGYSIIYRNGYMLPHHSRGLLEVARGMLDAADLSERFEE